MVERSGITIREMPSELRPRERLEQFGPDALQVQELIAIQLRVGNARMSALQLGEVLVSRFRNLRGLADASVQELSQVNGIGLAKACQLKASFELGKRLAVEIQMRPTISAPADAARLLTEMLRYFPEERFYTLLLDTRHQVIKSQEISVGTLNASLVHPREVFRTAIREGAAAIIAGHNHPSGDPAPSKEDIALTLRLAQAGELLGIPLLDHVVVGEGRYISLKEKGLM